MKHFFRGFWVFTAVIILVFSFGNATIASAKPINLLFAFMEPPMGPVAKVMKVWSEDLEKRTKGKIKVSLALGGALGKPGEYFGMTSKGVTDAAACIPAFGDPGLFPMSEMFELPYNIPSGKIASQAIIPFVKKGYLNKEFSEVKLMSAFGAPGDIFFTKNKPITSLADLKGKKIWNPQPGKVELLKKMGSIPVALPPPDLYPALKKGVVDGAFCNYMFLFIYNIAELVKYSVNGMPSGTVMVTTIMNKNKWDSLPSDIQRIIDSMNDEYSVKYGASFDTAFGYGKKAFFKMGGKELNWNPEELAKVNKTIEPLWEQWIKSKEKKGLPARQATGDFYQMLKGVGVENPALGFSPK